MVLNFWKVLNNTRIKKLTLIAILLVYPYPWIHKWNTTSKRYVHPHVYWSIMNNCQDMEVIKYSLMNESIKIIINIQIHTMAYYSVTKMKEMMLFVTTWVERKSEISQRMTTTAWSHLHVESQKKLRSNSQKWRMGAGKLSQRDQKN